MIESIPEDIKPVGKSNRHSDSSKWSLALQKTIIIKNSWGK